MKYLIIILSLIFISCSNKEIKTLEQNQVEMRDCISYENGERNGLSKYYYPTGQIKREIIYKKGIIKSWRNYKEDGTLESSYSGSGDNFFVEVFTTGVLYIFMPLTPFFN